MMRTPQPHPEVVNMTPSVLIIGYGWVGQFIGKYFEHADVVDLRPAGYPPELKKPMLYFARGGPRRWWRYAFICVPTPMDADGSCDLSYVEEAIAAWKDKVSFFCIKSTVSIGTTEYLGGKHDIQICFSPEYLGETVGHPLNEPRRETFIVLGGKKPVTRAFAELWSLVTNSSTRIYQSDARTAEMAKLMENCFIAAKVTFCNEFFDLAGLAGVDFNELRELWLADPRVGRSHTYVYRNNRGFGGKCLPKDLNNLTSFFRKMGQPARFIEFLLNYNSHMRGEKCDR